MGLTTIALLAPLVAFAGLIIALIVGLAIATMRGPEEYPNPEPKEAPCQ